MKYSCFTLMLPQFGPAEAVRLIKEAGYDGVEWRCAEQPEQLSPIPNCWTSNRATLDLKDWKRQANEFGVITRDNGLEISNLATYCRADQSDAVKTAIEVAQELGSPRLRICAPPYDTQANYHEVFRRSRESYVQAAELCRAGNVQGLLELHMGNIACSASLALRLLEGIDPRCVGVIYDPGNMVIEGVENWQIGCELLGDHLAFCHAKNCRFRPGGVTSSGAIRWELETCEMNTGFVDWLAVYRAFRRVGYDGWISNEDHVLTGVTSERLKSGLTHLKRCEELAAA